MKRLAGTLLLLALFVGITAGTVAVSVNQVSTFVQEENRQKTALVQTRLDETLTLLADLSQDAYIRDPQVSYLEKAEYLTGINQTEGLGYMMLRILDAEVNIYREGLGLASNLGSRDYMQRLYATGEQQVTDAFLAGADGTTINYTLTAAIQEDGKVVGALMAAIYGSEIDELLQDETAVNVLVGSQLQYMGGVSGDQFGLAVAQVLESEQNTSRPVEQILLDFHEERGGSFWGIGGGVHYFVYSPVDHCNWVVMTEVSVLPMLRNTLLLYGGSIMVLILAAGLLLRRKNPHSADAEVPDAYN